MKLRIFLAALMMVALLMLSDTVDAKTLFTFGTKVHIRQVRAFKDGKQGGDTGLPKSLLRSLKKKYKTRYKRYELVSEEVVSAKLGEDHEFELENGKTASVKILGYKADPKLITVKVQIEFTVQLITIKSGRHWFAIIEKGKEPLLFVVTPSLIQIRK